MRMTKAQWLWEYYSLREKEEEAVKTEVEKFKAFKIMTIKLFGLDLLNKKIEEDDPEELKEAIESGNYFTPLAILLGREAIVAHILKKNTEEKDIEEAMEDDEFEKLSAAVASGEDLGDMDPIINDPGPKLEWFNSGRVEELKSLGVKLVSNTKDVPHHSIDVKEIKDKRLQQELSRKKANQELEKQLEEDEQFLMGKRVTFDDA